MPITLDQIVEQTREMPVEVVAELVDRIMVAPHGGLEPPVAAAWKAETDRRIAEIESGKVEGVPLEESLARAQVRRPVILSVSRIVDGAGSAIHQLSGCG
jgi:putative addiction module component (TIGR02574 family)